MRGEYPSGPNPRYYNLELPPHARRILQGMVGEVEDSGTTSACAENTLWLRVRGVWPGNYLRMRGEYLENMQLKGY